MGEIVEAFMGSLENAFADGDRVARYHFKIAGPGSARHPFGVDLQNFIALRTMTSNTDAFRGGNPRVAPGHGDCLKEINPSRASVRHFETAGTIDLAQDRETSLRVADERDADLWVHQVIARVKFGDA